MSTGWAFYNAVRAWVAQHPIPPPADDDEADAVKATTDLGEEP